MDVWRSGLEGGGLGTVFLLGLGVFAELGGFAGCFCWGWAILVPRPTRQGIETSRPWARQHNR
jgi:hypothetical protein